MSWHYKILLLLVIAALLMVLNTREGGRGHWPVYFISPQSFKWRFLIRWLNNVGGFYWILIGWFVKSSVQTFQPQILIYKRGNFVYHHWGCTSIYWPLSLDPCLNIHFMIINNFLFFSDSGRRMQYCSK